MQGRGGMGAKVDAALNAVRGGVNAVVIAAGELITDSDELHLSECVCLYA